MLSLQAACNANYQKQRWKGFLYMKYWIYYRDSIGNHRTWVIAPDANSAKIYAGYKVQSRSTYGNGEIYKVMLCK